MSSLFGVGVWLLPVVLFYWGFLIFKRPDNRVPLVIGLASILMLVWWIGLFNEFSAGGEVGEKIGGILVENFGMFLSGLIFLTLIAITSFFMFSISPVTVVKKIANGLRTTHFDEKPVKTKKSKDVKINKNDVLDIIDDSEPEKRGLFGKKKPLVVKNNTGERTAKVAEIPKAALVSVGDPNWQTPSLDLLEKKQASADSGNIEQNIEIIKNVGIICFLLIVYFSRTLFRIFMIPLI
jgi:hypothetical protein